MNYDPDEDYTDDGNINSNQWALLISVVLGFLVICIISYVYG